MLSMWGRTRPQRVRNQRCLAFVQIAPPCGVISPIPVFSITHRVPRCIVRVLFISCVNIIPALRTTCALRVEWGPSRICPPSATCQAGSRRREIYGVYPERTWSRCGCLHGQRNDTKRSNPPPESWQKIFKSVRAAYPEWPGGKAGCRAGPPACESSSCPWVYQSPALRFLAPVQRSTGGKSEPCAKHVIKAGGPLIE